MQRTTSIHVGSKSILALSCTSTSVDTMVSHCVVSNCEPALRLATAWYLSAPGFDTLNGLVVVWVVDDDPPGVSVIIIARYSSDNIYKYTRIDEKLIFLRGRCIYHLNYQELLILLNFTHFSPPPPHPTPFKKSLSQ